MIVLKVMVALVVLAAMADRREARRQRRLALEAQTVPLVSVITR